MTNIMEYHGDRIKWDESKGSKSINRFNSYFQEIKIFTIIIEILKIYSKVTF